MVFSEHRLSRCQFGISHPRRHILGCPEQQVYLSYSRSTKLPDGTRSLQQKLLVDNPERVRVSRKVRGGVNNCRASRRVALANKFSTVAHNSLFVDRRY